MTNPKNLISIYDNYSESLQNLNEIVNSKIEEFKDLDLVKRIFNNDHTLWSDSPNEIANRLGWLDSPIKMNKVISDLADFSKEIRDEGIKNILLLGMGGSSLSSEVFKNVFKLPKDYPRLLIVDSTDPDFINDLVNRLDLKRTLFLVSTKSGSTVETLSLLKYFFNKCLDDNNISHVGNHFVAITDPGSSLKNISEKYKFRRIFINDPNIGGRFSALSYFGLVPAILIGVDINKLLNTAIACLRELKNVNKKNYLGNSTIRLGTTMGVLSEYGKDKLTFLCSKELYSFGYWVEQLIAESTGKEGKGILPVLDQSKLNDELIKEDRFFVLFLLKGDVSLEKKLSWLYKSKQPYALISIDNIYDIGWEFLRFEFATAIAGIVMEINPFDQPDVESAKIYTKEFLDSYKEKKQLEMPKTDFSLNGLNFISNCDINTIKHLKNLFDSGDFTYISIHAYIKPDNISLKKIKKLRDSLEIISKLPVTFGFGPRFLHSTGQLHKGDSGKGLFLQIVSKNENDLDIPDEIGLPGSYLSFGILKFAQAIGDYKALDNKNRKVIRVSISNDIENDIDKIIHNFN